MLKATMVGSLDIDSKGYVTKRFFEEKNKKQKVPTLSYLLSSSFYTVNAKHQEKLKVSTKALVLYIKLVAFFTKRTWIIEE